jgi:hypothetical protein
VHTARAGGSAREDENSRAAMLNLSRLHPDDTAKEIAPICQKILTTKLWNDGAKAESMTVPPQYEHASTSVDASSSTDSETQQSTQEGETSRSEQVWGGKPWKTNVVELEGEVLCSEEEGRVVLDPLLGVLT